MKPKPSPHEEPARKLLISKGIPEALIFCNLWDDEIFLQSFQPTPESYFILIAKRYKLSTLTDEQAQDLANRYHEVKDTPQHAPKQ